MKDEALKSFTNDLLAKWNESAPYGEQIPVDLPKQLADFAATHSGKDAEAMFEAFTTSDPEDPMNVLFDAIFTLAAEFTIARLADAVYDRNREALKLIDLVPHGTLATEKNDPNPACKHQHIMHPDQGGRMLFADTDSSATA